MSLNKSENGIENPGFVQDIGEYAKSPVKKQLDKLQQDNNTLQLESQDGESSGEVRVKWGNGLEFLMSCIAMSVGLGNIWRFPFTAYENGGGAFLIPYLIVLVVIGRPFYYMEMALGQFTSTGNVKMFERLAPAMTGIGYGQLVGVVCVATYYCSLMAITVFYLVNSFTGDLPWATCRDDWTEGLLADNVTCLAASNKQNLTAGVNTQSSSELWFKKEVLKEVSDISEGIGAPEWRLVICLLSAWIICFAVSRRGVQSSGKAAYFLAMFPYVVMIALLVRAATLEGASKGMLYFIEPKWDKLLSADVWYAAVTQCFFSLNVGFGTIVMYSSYNDFEHNINRDVMVVTLLDTMTSLLAGTTIFGILGNLAFELDLDNIEDVMNSGTGLAFISYPEAIAKFTEVPWLFSILFFVMLFVLGIGSLVALQGVANTVITDSFPNLKKWQVSLGTAGVGFLIGLIYVTPGGQFMVTLVDFFGGTFIIFTLAIFEIVTVMWYYGLEDFCNDIEFMLKQKVSVYYKFCWGIVTPCLLIVIYVYFLFTIDRLTYEKYEFPDSAIISGWMIVAFTMAQFILWISYYLHVNRRLSLLDNIRTSLDHHESWGPADKIHHEQWRIFKEEKLRERKIEGETQQQSAFRRFLQVASGRR